MKSLLYKNYVLCAVFSINLMEISRIINSITYSLLVVRFYRWINEICKSNFVHLFLIFINTIPLWIYELVFSCLQIISNSSHSWSLALNICTISHWNILQKQLWTYLSTQSMVHIKRELEEFRKMVNDNLYFDTAKRDR